MLKLRCILLPLILTLSSAGADSDRSAAVFESQGCIQCHSINGRGGKTGPDLGRRIGRGYTPAALVSTMWNHAPKMWEAMTNAGMEIQLLRGDAAADLVAFFSSSRFFDKPADAARGRRAFESNRCSECHGIDQSRTAGAPPVSTWKLPGDPLELADAMWNHASRMQQEFAARGISWPTLTGQELADILVYLRHLPLTHASASFQTSSAKPGEELFESNGCVKCHTGALDLRGRLQGKTLTDITAAMWSAAVTSSAANAALYVIQARRRAPRLCQRFAETSIRRSQ